MASDLRGLLIYSLLVAVPLGRQVAIDASPNQILTGASLGPADLSVLIRWMLWTGRRMFQFLSAGCVGPEGGCFSFYPLDGLDRKADVSVLIRWMCWTGRRMFQF